MMRWVNLPAVSDNVCGQMKFCLQNLVERMRNPKTEGLSFCPLLDAVTDLDLYDKLNKFLGDN